MIFQKFRNVCNFSLYLGSSATPFKIPFMLRSQFCSVKLLLRHTVIQWVVRFRRLSIIFSIIATKANCIFPRVYYMFSNILGWGDIISYMFDKVTPYLFGTDSNNLDLNFHFISGCKLFMMQVILLRHTIRKGN